MRQCQRAVLLLARPPPLPAAAAPGASHGLGGSRWAVQQQQQHRLHQQQGSGLHLQSSQWRFYGEESGGGSGNESGMGRFWR